MLGNGATVSTAECATTVAVNDVSVAGRGVSGDCTLVSVEGSDDCTVVSSALVNCLIVSVFREVAAGSVLVFVE